MQPKVKRLTFGLELEYSRASETHDALMRTHGFAPRRDASVRAEGGGTGFEAVTPILTATIKDDGTFTYDETIIQGLCNVSSAVNETCGLHVHVGRPKGTTKKSEWTAAQCRAWMLSGLAIEDSLYGACPASRKASTHARPIKEIYAPEDFGSAHPALPAAPSKYSNPKRYCWLNLVETVRPGNEQVEFTEAVRRAQAEALGTVEIRMLGNTRRFDYIRAWVDMCLHWGVIIANTEPTAAIAGIAHSGWLANDIARVLKAKQSAVRLDTAPATPAPATPARVASRRSPRRTEPPAAPSNPTWGEVNDAMDDAMAERPPSPEVSWTSTTTGRLRSTNPNMANATGTSAAPSDV